MATDHITVTGIRPGGDSIRPLGHHLRWAFPARFGFPAKGFFVYRRKSGDFKPGPCLKLAKEKVPTGQILYSGSILEGVSFHYPRTVEIKGNGQNLTVDLPGPDLLELRFREPMACVGIRVEDIQGPIHLRAYAGSTLIATSPTLTDNNGSLEVTAPYITRITIPLNFKILAEVCHLSMKAVCEDKNWGQEIAKLPRLDSVDQALLRLETDIHNRYASDREAAVKRYEPGLKSLLEWLDLLQNPGADSPDQIRLYPPPESKSPLLSIRPQGMLILAALDPNIARFLSLYWVDEDNATKGPQDGISYDYKVEGQWQDQNVGCGLLFGLGPEKSGLPLVNYLLEGDQLPGLRWQDKNQVGRVGLHWPRPKEGQGAVQPVLFDLRRDPGIKHEKFLTEHLPVLTPDDAWANDSAALFIDSDVPLGTHIYRLQAIDLFGQVGNTIDSTPIDVKDLVAPPPPVRLHAALTQPGYPWREKEQLPNAKKPAALTLQFEYGDAQHCQAPDAKTFRVYWRADSMFKSQSVTIEHHVSTQALEDNLKIHTVRVQVDGGIDLGPFLDGKLSRASDTDSPLPATERHHYQIAALLPTGELQLAPSENEFVDGSYRLVSDPRLRSNWTKLKITIPVRPPLQGLLQSTAPFQAKAKRVETLAPRQDQLALMPASHRPAQLDQPPPIVEVELDRRFLETNLFAGGTLQVEAQSYPILYSTSGSVSPSRLGLPPGTIISIGDSLTIQPAQPFLSFSANIQQIERLPGNRLAITLPAQANPAGTAHLLGGIVTIEGQKHNILQVREDAAGLRLELRPVGALPDDLTDWINKEAQITPPIVQALTILGVVPDEIVKAPGGEIAFDIIKEKQLVTYTAHVVSDTGISEGVFNLLVRLSPAAQAALQIGVTDCRYYAPYQQQLNVKLPFTVGNPDPDTTIDLPMPVGQGSQNIYLALTTNDERYPAVPPSDVPQNEGPLSSPAQVTAVRPPPEGRPSRPYPCGADAAVAGYATPPDRQGRATLCLAWDAGTLSPADGVRYEVARTLDNTILATHRRNWLLGGPSLDGAPAALDGALSGVTFDPARGLYRAALTANLAGADPIAFRGGRLSQNGHRFQVTTIVVDDAGVLQLILRPMVKVNAPTNGDAEFEQPPDYDAMRDDIAGLLTLAAANLDTFGLITGVPIPHATDPDTGAPLPETQFTDEIPGIGRNRFFYIVRAVDAAENRSAWSDVSCPFYQVDTTPPETPREFRVFPGDRNAILVWSKSQEPDSTRFRIYRSEEQDDFNLLSAPIYTEVGSDELGPQLLVAIDGSLTLPRPIELTIPAGLSESERDIAIAIQIVVQELTAPLGASNLFVPSTGRVIFDRNNNADGSLKIMLRGLSGLTAAFGVPLKVIVGDQLIDGDYSMRTWIDRSLTGGRVYTYRIAALKTLRTTSASGDQPFGELVVMSDVSSSVSVMALDRSAPPAPVIENLEWVDTSGNVVIEPILATHARLIVEAPEGTAWVMIERRAGLDGPWTSPAHNGARGWQEWQVGLTQAAFLYVISNSTQLWQYRAHARTSDGRTSVASNPVTLGG